MRGIKRLNRLLSVIIAMLAIIIAAAPVLPELELAANSVTNETNGFEYDSDLAELARRRGDLDPNVELPRPPMQNWLVIPAIKVNGRIVEGRTSDSLDKGVWRRPFSSTPDQGGNTVLVAHRFMYLGGPNSFYHLPKMKEGDVFSLFWNGREYVYQVFVTMEVLANDTFIEQASNSPIVTLYTCTPLWTSDKRFVVKARLVENPLTSLTI